MGEIGDADRGVRQRVVDPVRTYVRRGDLDALTLVDDRFAPRRDPLVE